MSNLVQSAGSNQFVFPVKVRPSLKEGAVKAFVDIKYYDVIINGLTVVEHNAGHFVGFPSNIGKNGKRFPVVDFAEPTRTAVANMVLAAAKELL